MKHTAIFLDRDGVINKYRVDYVKSVQEFVILPKVYHYLKRFGELGFKLIIITNQSAVNRGLMTFERLETIHDYLIRELRAHGCQIDDIFYCPHTPDENCECRKPKPGMFLEAAKRHNIDLLKSWIIGDNETDIEAGNTIGCRTFKIKTDSSLDDAFYAIKSNTAY